MPIIPIRNISKRGVITDMDAYDLPIDSLQMGVNVRMEDGVVSRGPVLRSVGNIGDKTQNLFTVIDANGTTRLLIERSNGRLYEWQYPSTETAVYPTTWVDTETTTAASTFCTLNGVTYSNRSDRSPWYRQTATFGARFADLSTYSANALADLPSTARFKSMRAMNGMLIGINVLRSAIEYPTSVWWSNYSTEYGAPPPDWDFTSTTSSSGINTLGEMEGVLVDGCRLGNSMILYGNKETWSMDYTGTAAIFSFRRLFSGGIINVNCAVEHEGRHYVFGADDIFATDGVSKKSIASGRVKKFIYKTMVRSESERFFVHHNKELNEIMFCYVSTDAYLGYPKQTTSNGGCNRAAVYNINSDSWYFYDLPWITAAIVCPVTFSATFDDATSSTLTIDSVGGSISTYGVNETPSLVVAGNAFTHPNGSAIANKLSTFELYDSTNTAFVMDDVATMPSTIMKQKIDLDEIGVPLRGYKLLSGLYPQAELDVDDTPFEITVGTSTTPSEQTVWALPQTFGSTDYKIDTHSSGRYLAIKIVGGKTAWSLSGYDADITVLSEL